MTKISGYNLGVGIVFFILAEWQLKVATIYYFIQKYTQRNSAIFLVSVCFIFAVFCFYLAFREEKIKK